MLLHSYFALTVFFFCTTLSILCIYDLSYIYHLQPKAKEQQCLFWVFFRLCGHLSAALAKSFMHQLMDFIKTFREEALNINLQLIYLNHSIQNDRHS